MMNKTGHSSCPQGVYRLSGAKNIKQIITHYDQNLWYHKEESTQGANTETYLNLRVRWDQRGLPGGSGI